MKTIYFSLLVILFASCSNRHAEFTEKIQAMEKELFSSSTSIPDPAKAKEIIQLYIEFANTFPQDTLAPDYLFKAAEVSASIGEANSAIDLLDKVILNYQKSNKNEMALFYKAFIYETQLSDYFNAGKTYDQFISAFPNSDLLDDALAAKENLGKTPEELIRQFEENIANDTVMFPS
ncbi:MAG TPA: tetratricopeptide repeat protein [Bacteroidia bacterium]|nr:tetratricopeptide repeat protein [Bacteroidia bacterium]